MIDNDFLYFYTDWDEDLKKHGYERHCNYDFNPEGVLQFILIPLQDIDVGHLYYWNKEKSCFINPKWEIDQKAWIHNETKPGSIPLPKYFSNLVEDNKYLKRVGYWQSAERETYLPHPKPLVKLGWRKSERSMVIAYLKSGHECGRWCGYSYCRFDCFLPPKENASELVRRELMDGIRSMGTRDLTDGEWVWPEGLAHYVEKHDVCLPDAFVETMQKNSWLVPAKINFKHCSEVGVSELYWVNWAIEYVKTKQC